MPRQRFTGGRSRQQNERLIRRYQRRFDGGEEKKQDRQSTDISTNAVAILENARGHETNIEGRGGSELYTAADITLTVPDGTSQTLTYAMQQTDGLLYVANGNAVPDVGDIFMISAQYDLSGTPFDTAKGSAPKAYDLFEITNNTNGSETILFIGNMSSPAMPEYATSFSVNRLSAGSTTIVSSAVVNADIVGTFFVWEDGSKELVVEWISGSRFRVEEVLSSLNLTNEGYFSAPLVASLFHKSLRKFICMFGRRLYVADVPVKKWTEIVIQHSTKPSDNFSRIFEDRDFAVLVNEAGDYRIKPGESSPYAWCMNANQPTEKPILGDSGNPASVVDGDQIGEAGYPYIYRTLYSYTKFQLPEIERPIDLDRTDAEDGMIILQQTAPTKQDGEQIDYKEYASRFPVGPVYDDGSPPDDYGNLISIIKSPSDVTASVEDFAALTEGTFAVEFDNQSGGSNDFNIIVDFTGVTTLGEVAARIQDACRTYDELQFLEVTFGSTPLLPGATAPRFFFAWPELGYDESLMAIKAVSPAYGTDISQASYLRVSGTSPTYSNKYRNIQLRDFQAIDNQGMTHLTVWRDRDGGAAGVALGNNPEIYTWNADVPICKALKVSITANTVTVVEGALSNEDFGSTLSIYDSAAGTLLSEGPIVQDADNIGTYYVSATDFTNQPTGNVIASLGTDDIMEGYQSGDTITITTWYKIIRDASGGVTVPFIKDWSGVGLTDDDEGKPVFWSNGRVSWIKDVTGTLTATAMTEQENGESGSELPMTMNPTKRGFNDEITDEDLLARAPYFPLNNRFWEPLPLNGVGIVVPGFLFVAKQDERIYYYSELGIDSGVLSGYYNPAFQINDELVDVVIGFEKQDEILIIKTNRGTYKVNLNTPVEAGNAALGEHALVLGDPEPMDLSVGFDVDGAVDSMENNALFMFTNERGLRILSGTEYSDNLAVGKIHRSEINKLEPNGIVKYDPNLGALTWGYRST